MIKHLHRHLSGRPSAPSQSSGEQIKHELCLTNAQSDESQWFCVCFGRDHPIKILISETVLNKYTRCLVYESARAIRFKAKSAVTCTTHVQVGRVYVCMALPSSPHDLSQPCFFSLLAVFQYKEKG